MTNRSWSIGLNRYCRFAGFLRFIFLSAFLVSVSELSFAAGKGKDEFPKLGGIQIGKTPYNGYDDPAYQRAIARLDLAIMSNKGDAGTAAAKEIKQINPSIMLGPYFNLTAVLERSSGYFGPLNDKLSKENGPNNTNAADWWLRDTDGNRITGASPGMVRSNPTAWVKADSSGRRWPQYKARYDYDWMMHDQVWDIWYQDVVSWKPKFQGRDIDADFSGGRTSDAKEIYKAWRQAHNDHWKTIRQLRPDIMIVGNINWYLQHAEKGALNMPLYEQQIEGGILEHVMHWERSIEAKKGWHTLREWYSWTMGYMRDPKLVIFNVYGDPEDYRFFRYAFATCLMDDGYFDFSPEGAYNFGTVQWFDEFDLAGTAGTNWMGRAITPPQMSAWKNGVFRRDFENAVVLVNPRGNGERTVSLESGLARIKGNQDPTVNSGQAATSIRLKDGDGIVLRRTTEAPDRTAAAPVPPTLTVQ